MLKKKVFMSIDTFKATLQVKYYSEKCYNYNKIK